MSLGNDSIFKIFRRFAIPSILAMLAQTTASLIDSIFIGRFVGPQGIGGITLFFPILNFIIGFSSMIAIGGVTLAGIHSGRKETEIANNYFNITFTMVFILSLASSVVTWFLADIEFLQNRLGLEEVTAGLTSEYARILTYFYAPFLVSFLLAFFVKLAGRPVIVVSATVGGTLVNILLDWLLVGRSGMGMTGAALATGVSQLVPCCVLLVILIKKTNWYFARPKFRWKEVKRLLFNGSSEFMTMASLAISGFIYNWIILRMVGESGIAAYGIALQASNFVLMLFYGIAESIHSPVSFNYGAELFQRVKKLRSYAIYTVVGIGIFIFPVLYLGGASVASIFTTHSETIDMSEYIIRFFAFSFLFGGVNIVITTYYTSINRPLASASLAVTRSLIGIVAGMLVFPTMFPGPGLWMPIIFTEILTIVLAVFLLIYNPLVKKDIRKKRSSGT